MRSLNRLTALCVGVLLLAAPAAFACGELGAMVMSQCPMADAPMNATAEMSHSADTSMCHKAGAMAKDCCDARPAPEPMQAMSFETAKLLAALEVTDPRMMAVAAPACLRPHSTPADALRLHDLGRYTLFSSFLL